jgi:hypothetical protein
MKPYIRFLSKISIVLEIQDILESLGLGELGDDIQTTSHVMLGIDNYEVE